MRSLLILLSCVAVVRVQGGSCSGTSEPVRFNRLCSPNPPLMPSLLAPWSRLAVKERAVPDKVLVDGMWGGGYWSYCYPNENGKDCRGQRDCVSSDVSGYHDEVYPGLNYKCFGDDGCNDKKSCDPQKEACPCFDASSTFTTPDGPKRMDAVKVGDKVLSARTDGSLVWDTIAVDASHIGPRGGLDDEIDYLSIGTASGHTLTLTDNHYMHATRDSDAACCSANTLILAKKVSVGDTVFISVEGMSALQPSNVTTIDRVKRTGLHNFWLDQADDTRFRSLVVNGVAAVSFTVESRLVNTLGFDAADRMVDPLREMARSHQSHPLPVSLTRAAPWIGVEVQNIIADCVEARMAGCSDETIRVKIEELMDEVSAQHPAEADVLFRAFEELATRHLRLVPAAGRRLVASLASMQVTKLIAHEAKLAAMHVCAWNEQCNHGMIVNVNVNESGSNTYVSNPVLVLAIILGVIALLLVFLTVTLACVLRWALMHWTRTDKELATAKGPVAVVAELAEKTDVAKDVV